MSSSRDYLCSFHQIVDKKYYYEKFKSAIIVSLLIKIKWIMVEEIQS
jgi:hypothetical protein